MQPKNLMESKEFERYLSADKVTRVFGAFGFSVGVSLLAGHLLELSPTTLVAGQALLLGLIQTYDRMLPKRMPEMIVRFYLRDAEKRVDQKSLERKEKDHA